MSKFIERVKVVLTAAPTYLVAIAGFLTAVREEAIDQLPEAWQVPAASAITQALVIIGTAVLIIRQVTPVPPEQRGVLPRG